MIVSTLAVQSVATPEQRDEALARATDGVEAKVGPAKRSKAGKKATKKSDEAASAKAEPVPSDEADAKKESAPVEAPEPEPDLTPEETSTVSLAPAPPLVESPL